MTDDAAGRRVTGLCLTPVKGTRVQAVPEIELGVRGAAGNRAFCVIDERRHMINGKRHGALQTVVADYDRAAEALALTFADGARIDAPVRYGETLAIRFFSHTSPARVLDGPWSAALSERIGLPLRLVEPELGVDRGPRATVSMISRGSLRRLAQAAGQETVDGRRFRMLVEIDGVDPHAEDRWVGERVRIGPALVAFNGHVGRCVVTSRDPESGEADLPTLKLLGAYRGDVESTEPIPFGVYGEVLEPGTVRIGDPVALTVSETR